MPRPKKGKARAPVPAHEEGGGEGALAPIPENPAAYEGYDNYEQGGEAWQNQNEWPDDGAYDHGYAQGDQLGHQPDPQTEMWDTGQYSQQGWVPPTASPVNAPPPSGAAAFASWGRDPQQAYGPPQPPQQPPPAAPPPGMPPPRPRQDPGLTSGTSSWKNWGAEAMANSRHLAPPPSHPPGTGYGQQSRVTFASHDSYVPVFDRAEATPQAQRMIFDSIIGSRGDAPVPRQPQQRSPIGNAQNPTHTPKQSRKSKKERRAQEQSVPNDWSGQQENSEWAQENSGWDQGNSQWEKEGYGWSQQNAQSQWDEKQNAQWEGKQDPAWDQWGSGEARRDDLASEGYTDSEGWDDVAGRRSLQRSVTSPFVPAPNGDSPYPMSSRTMAYAKGTMQSSPDAFPPRSPHRRNTVHDYTNIEALESYGEALKPVENAFFGRERKARDRIHWQFPHDKDERVRHALEWLRVNTRGVAAFGLNKFLQTRERGALFINASYDGSLGNSPALDWLTYEDVVETRDRLLQESVGFYDPAAEVIVFVFLPSKSGNSLAMWRRKVTVFNSADPVHLREIDIAKAALRKDYPVWVDEMRSPPYRLSSLQSPGAPPKKKKKKKGFFRRLFRIFKIVW